MTQSADVVIIALRKRLSGYLRLSFVATITENYNYEAFLELRFKTGTKSIYHCLQHSDFHTVLPWFPYPDMKSRQTVAS